MERRLDGIEADLKTIQKLLCNEESKPELQEVVKSLPRELMANVILYMSNVCGDVLSQLTIPCQLTAHANSTSSSKIQALQALRYYETIFTTYSKGQANYSQNYTVVLSADTLL